MKMSLGEMIDRYSIEYRKNLFGCQNDAFLAEVYGALTDEFGLQGEALCTGARIGVLNDAIAQLEWQIRAGKDLPLEEIGRRARAVRQLNDVRVQEKNALTITHEEKRLYAGGPEGIDSSNTTMDFQEPKHH